MRYADGSLRSPPTADQTPADGAAPGLSSSSSSSAAFPKSGGGGGGDKGAFGSSALEVLERFFCVRRAAAPAPLPWFEAAIAEGDVCYLCQEPFGRADRHDMVRGNCACRHPMHGSCMTRQIVTGLVQGAKHEDKGGRAPLYTLRCGQCWTSFFGKREHDARDTLKVDSGDDSDERSSDVDMSSDGDSDSDGNELWRQSFVIEVDMLS